MQLPESLQSAIERESAAISHDALRKASLQLSASYFECKSSIPMFQDRAVRAAYLSVRMPATYAAIYAVLEEYKKRMSSPFVSFADIGAGPGTGAWAAASLFPELTSLFLVEKSRPMVEVGQRLALASESALLQKASWLCQSLEETLPKADLALLSYVVAELRFSEVAELLERLWEKYTTLIFIEPGTPVGARRILQIRDWALAKGAFLIAPCPHSMACPMQAPNWCHFPARVERTRLHKFLKGGTLGYEDEKFSYLIFGRAPSHARSRIIGPVHKGSGFVRLPLCIEGELRNEAVSRKSDQYRAARNARWGDGWDGIHLGSKSDV